ncbi:MAG: sugar phosphate nucleotidyltransferase, partial [Candidatus Omnitrophota bacterium]
MKALILAAGYATRLYPLTRNRPKPLLKLGKKPIVERIIDKIDSLPGVDEVI